MKRSYVLLARNIRNWPAYFIHKLTRAVTGRGNRRIRFVTRRRRIPFQVPEELLNVFKEIFMYDEYALDVLLEELPVSATVVDIGANIGLFSIAVLDQSPHPIRRLIAVEPVPSNATMLQENFKSLHTGQLSVTVVQSAVGGCGGVVRLATDPSKEFSVVASAVEDRDGSEGIEVSCITLDGLMRDQGIGQIDLLKLDCEGSEFEILFGASAETLETISAMVLEVHPDPLHGRDWFKLRAVLAAAQFTIETKGETESAFVVRATRPGRVQGGVSVA